MKKTVVAALLSLLLVSCTRTTQSGNKNAPSGEVPPLPPITYTNERLGFSVEMPPAITVMECSHHSEDGKSYVMPDQQVAAPFVHTDIPNGVVFHPEWYREVSGEVETANSRFYADCQKRMINGSSLVRRNIYRDFPYWTVLSETVRSEKDIPQSVLRHCTKFAKFTALTPTAQSGILEVGIDVDMTKTKDSSENFCPDLVYARYVSATSTLYYLYSNGKISLDDPAPEQIQHSLRFLFPGQESAKKCGDILTQFGTKPEQLEFMNCDVVDLPQIALSARYRVPGSQASIVEDFLKKKYGMNALHFACCGWEPEWKLEAQGPGHFTIPGRYFSITLSSDETGITDRARWSEIPYFYVVVEEHVNV